MATNPQTFSHFRETSDSAPALPLLAREAGSFAYTRIRAAFAPAVSLPIRGDGRPVMIIPGFMASDATTSRLRRSLRLAGFDAHGWGLGRNRGVRTDTLERIAERAAPLAANGPITLIGWSLGGVVAREYAKIASADVAKVITLGSPFSGSLRANNAWRVYELIAGHSVDAPPIPAVPHIKPPVQTIAFWSHRDGVVSPGSARGNPGEVDASIELDCSHMAFVADPAAIRTIGSAILS